VGSPGVLYTRSADQDLDEIERGDPKGYTGLAVTLAAAFDQPPRTLMVPAKCRQASDGQALGFVPSGDYLLVVTLASDRPASLVRVLSRG